MMRPAELQRLPHATRARGQLREGLRYVRRNPILLWPIVLVFFVGTFGYNFAIILSAYTQNVFDSGADLYGLLNSAMAAGSVTGALVAARRTSANLTVLFTAAAAFGLGLIVLGLTPWFWAFLCCWWSSASSRSRSTPWATRPCSCPARPSCVAG